MCGRFSCTLHPSLLIRYFKTNHVIGYKNYRPKYNITPENYSAIIFTNTEGIRILCYAKFGLIPKFNSSRTSYNTINARIENVEKSPLYRCIIAVDGIYEWHRINTSKTYNSKIPYFFRLLPKENGCMESLDDDDNNNNNNSGVLTYHHNEDTTTNGSSNQLLHVVEYFNQYFPGFQTVLDLKDQPLLLAGFYDYNKETKFSNVLKDDDNTISNDNGYSFTILTMPSHSTPMESIHCRTPVFLTPILAKQWLNFNLDYSALVHNISSACRYMLCNKMMYYQVSSAVGNIRNDSIDLIQPVSNTTLSTKKNDSVSIMNSPVVTTNKKKQSKEESTTFSIKKESSHDNDNIQPTIFKKQGTMENPRKRESHSTQIKLTHFMKKLKTED